MNAEQQLRKAITGRGYAKRGITYFTTGVISRMLGVAPRTISIWCDRGWLKAYRIPNGSTGKVDTNADRRVLPHDLLDFIRSKGMPIPIELRYLVETPRIILWGLMPGEQLSSIKHATRYNTFIECVDALASASPVSISHVVYGDVDGRSMMEQLVTYTLSKHDCRMILIVSEDAEPYQIDNRKVRCMKRPINWANVEDVVNREYLDIVSKRFDAVDSVNT